jgi:hypothetical protein
MKPYDEIIITGIASNPNGVEFTMLHAVIATISKDGYIKVWPVSDDVEYDKIWFNLSEVTHLEISKTGRQGWRFVDQEIGASYWACGTETSGCGVHQSVQTKKFDFTVVVNNNVVCVHKATFDTLEMAQKAAEEEFRNYYKEFPC